MNKDDDTITILEDEQINMFHVLSRKVGELGIIYIPTGQIKFCFKQTDLNKYLKTYHVIGILHLLNDKNGVENVKKT